MRRLLAALFAGALFFSACSSGGSNTSTPVDETTSTTIAPIVLEDVPLADHAIPEYAASEDTFSFANFGGGEAPADLTVNMTRRLYGDSQVCSDVTDGQCTPYPVILQLMSQANKSMRGGLCEGLAVLSLRLAGDVETLLSYQNADTVNSLIKEDPALLSEIAYWYVTQFASEVQETASAFLEKSPAELAQVLMYDFAEAEKGNPHTGFTIGIYSEQGGHAVTPYRVEEMPSGYRIYIYDSNWPGEERWIDVSKEGTWMYALAATNPTERSEAWSGGTGTMELTPMRARSGPFTCSFCPQEEGAESGTMLTVAASGSKQMSLKIETESGQRLGYYDGAFVNEIPGATYRYLISGPSTADPVLVFLPPGIDDFSADVEEIQMPKKEEDKPKSSKDRIAELIEEKVEEETEQKFSLLVLNEEKSVQIEAVIVEEEEPERWEQPDETEIVVEETQSLLDFSDEAIEIAEIEEATVAIAVDALEVEVELSAGQQIEVAFAPEPPVTEQPPSQPGQPDEPVIEAPVQDFLNIAIEDDTGEVLAAVEVDLSDYRVEDVEERGPPTTVGPGQPPEEEVEEEVAPLTIEISFDEELGEIVQEEQEIEAWVASDAEYYQAIAEDRLDEVLGESYVEEIQELVEEWEAPEIFDEEEEIDFTAILSNVEDDYWEDEQWEEVEYDDEWFEEERELMDELFGEELDVEELFETVEEFVEEVEEVRELFFAEREVEEEEYWDEVEEITYEDDFAFQEINPELEEQLILEEMGLEEWNETLLGPPPSETVEWTEEDWEEYDEEREEEWVEEEWDEQAFEQEVLEELGIDEWPEEWGPSPTEAAEWTEEDWNEHDREMAGDEESRILEEEGLDEWPEDWGPSPSETALWDESDWVAYDEEQEAIWEEEMGDGTFEDNLMEFLEETQSWEEEEWEEFNENPDEMFEEIIIDDEGWGDWTAEDEEQWISEEELDWMEETEDWTEEDWENWDNFMEGGEESPEEEWVEPWVEEEWGDENWTGDDEEQWILEQEGLDEWPEDWGPSPSESWDWTEEDWQEFDEQMEEEWEDEETHHEEEEESLEELDENTESESDVPSDTEMDEEQMEEEDGDSEEIEWDNPYADCMGTSACENAPGGYDSWDEWEQENDPNWEPPPEPGEPDYIPPPEPPEPPPPPPPVYWYDEATETWDQEGDTVLSSNTLSTTTESTATSVLARGTDGHWYETITTETTTTTQSQAVSTVHFTTFSQTSWCGGDQYSSQCGGTGAIAGNTYTTVSTGATTNNAVVTTATEVVPASCSQGGFTGLGDWCIVDSNSRNDYDHVAFSIPTAAEEDAACLAAGGAAEDCTDGDGLIDIRIDAESNLTRSQFNSNNEHGDPYIYLHHDTDSDDGEHSGDMSEITVGNLIEADDDGGRDCGSHCNNPPSNATDPDETPNVTLTNGDPVIENVADSWDSRIERELSAGDYVLRGSVYNGNNDGWYRLTIRDADVTYPPEETVAGQNNSA